VEHSRKPQLIVVGVECSYPDVVSVLFAESFNWNFYLREGRTDRRSVLVPRAAAGLAQRGAASCLHLPGWPDPPLRPPAKNAGDRSRNNDAGGEGCELVGITANNVGSDSLGAVLLCPPHCARKRARSGRSQAPIGAAIGLSCFSLLAL
jgi:hypothetical protein